VCQPILGRDGGNIASVLSPDDVRLTKTVIWWKEGITLLLRSIVVLLAATNTSARARLKLGGVHRVLAIVVG
jgi:hypothetical protein